jgi:hypothetical protein
MTLTISLSSVSRLSGQYAILDISQSYRSQWPFTGIAVTVLKQVAYIEPLRFEGLHDLRNEFEVKILAINTGHVLQCF